MKQSEADRFFHHSHLFTVRMWRETLDEGRTEWRLRVQHVLSGERRYFRDWNEFEAYLEQKAQALETEEHEENS